MKTLGVLLIVLAVLLFVGVDAFGSVNQFEIDTGLTVEALILSAADVNEPMVVDFVEYAVYSEVTNYTINLRVARIAVNYNIPAYSGFSQRTEAVLTDRLKYPLPDPP